MEQQTPKAKPAATLSFVEPYQVPKKIEKIQFGLMSGRDIERMSVVEVTHDTLYNQPKRTPFAFGPLDLRMGTTDKAATCETCGEKLVTCPGHFGHIRLNLPVFHLGYFRAVLTIMNCICKNCSSLLLGKEDRAFYLRFMRSPKTDSLKRAAALKKISDACKKQLNCSKCGFTNGIVKKMKQQVRLFHDRYTKNEQALRQFGTEASDAKSKNADMKTLLESGKVLEELNPLQVLALLEGISDEDCEILDMNPSESRPADLMITHLPVPPNCIRPSVPMTTSAGSNEDDLTVKIAEIVRANNTLQMYMSKGFPVIQVTECWQTLQALVATYFNAEMPGAPQTMSRTGKMKPMRGFYQRLKGKMGRFRGNLSGKRVDHSGRTVISPDPNIQINQVVVPQLVAKILTYPERVTVHNIGRLREMVTRGPDVWPGANHVMDQNGVKRFLGYGSKERAAQELCVGHTVERHLIDDDLVLFNRQPSLHRISIMCHRAKILPWKTFRFNECCCTPYNADFDGDEMNLHVPQTEEARAEAQELMGVVHNLVTPRNGDPLIAATQDFLTASWLMTRKNVFYSRSQFMQICAWLGDAMEEVDIPPPALIKPIPLWTGKQVFGLLLKPNAKTDININIELEEAGYVKGSGCMCPHDGYVIFRNSELLSGHVGKQVLGKETKTSIFYILMRDKNTTVAAQAMSRLAKMTSRWITLHGFTIGIEDVTPSETLRTKKQDLMDNGNVDCENLILKWKRGEMETLRGCNEEQTLETLIKSRLNSLRGEASKECMQTLHWDNKPLIMALCKSKGSEINIAQMIACVGQQVIGDVRIPDGFIGRSLPHFDMGSKEPEAKGFVANSFYSGMTATEFFFHTMAGRVGLVDTAVKTAETGYMQRRLMKALEDLSVQYDYTVRNSEGGIVQFEYGDDSLDPSLMEGKDDGQPVHFQRLYLHYSVVNKKTAEESWLGAEGLDDVYQAAIQREKKKFVGLRPMSGKFIEDMKKFLLSTRVTKNQLVPFVEDCCSRYRKALIEPGTPVGALCGQSIGEPGTQMTLKTFHFAGVESMNVTLGVPRIKEIINAAKTISTPFIEAEMSVNTSETIARIVKGRIERTTLGEIAEYIKEVYTENMICLHIKLDLECIAKLQLNINAAVVRTAILCASKLKIKDKHVTILNDRKLKVYPLSATKEQMFYSIQSLKKNLPAVLISGVPTVTRAVINKYKANNDETPRFRLVVEGVGLREVMATSGIKGTVTKTNHIMEVAEVLGIEAARKTIINQLHYTMCDAHGIKIDPRHTALLADLMSFKGEVLGITRFGIKKMKESVLMLASFEKTVDNLFEAASHGRVDAVNGVSECIIMGSPIPLGTGLFKILHDHPGLSKAASSLTRPTPPLMVLNSKTHRLDITK